MLVRCRLNMDETGRGTREKGGRREETERQRQSAGAQACLSVRMCAVRSGPTTFLCKKRRATLRDLHRMRRRQKTERSAGRYTLSAFSNWWSSRGYPFPSSHVLLSPSTSMNVLVHACVLAHEACLCTHVLCARIAPRNAHAHSLAHAQSRSAPAGEHWMARCSMECVNNVLFRVYSLECVLDHVFSRIGTRRRAFEQDPSLALFSEH